MKCAFTGVFNYIKLWFRTKRQRSVNQRKGKASTTTDGLPTRNLPIIKDILNQTCLFTSVIR